MSESCGNCRFWLIRDNDLAPGEEPFEGNCQRYPPLPMAHIAQAVEELHCYHCYGGYEWLMRPNVMEDDWCGEWKPRSEADTTERKITPEEEDAYAELAKAAGKLRDAQANSDSKQ